MGKKKIFRCLRAVSDAKLAPGNPEKMARNRR